MLSGTFRELRQQVSDAVRCFDVLSIIEATSGEGNMQMEPTRHVHAITVRATDDLHVLMSWPSSAQHAQPARYRLSAAAHQRGERT
jgi:hypothetical protein